MSRHWTSYEDGQVVDGEACAGSAWITFPADFTQRDHSGNERIVIRALMHCEMDEPSGKLRASVQEIAFDDGRQPTVFRVSGSTDPFLLAFVERLLVQPFDDTPHAGVPSMLRIMCRETQGTPERFPWDGGDGHTINLRNIELAERPAAQGGA